MKKIMTIAVLACTALMLASCGASRRTQQVYTQPAYSQAPAASPLGEVFEVPCSEKDTPEYFVGLGIASGTKARMGELQLVALTNAQNVVRTKMQHAYEGAITDYMNSIGVNAGTDIANKVERAGTQIMDFIVNDTEASCGPKFSIDDKGNVTCYIGIHIPRRAVVETITDYVSEDEELKVRFDEENFRKRMLENFEKYKEQK